MMEILSQLSMREQSKWTLQADGATMQNISRHTKGPLTVLELRVNARKGNDLKE